MADEMAAQFAGGGFPAAERLGRGREAGGHAEIVEEAFGIDFAEINYDLTLLDSVSAIAHLVEQRISMRAA